MDGKRGVQKYLVAIVLGILIAEEITGQDTDVSNAEYIMDYYQNPVKTWASYYGEYPVGVGACSLDPLSPMATQPGWIRVAGSISDVQKSLGCGMCVQIKGSGKGKGITPITGVKKAIIIDKCGACQKGGYDLFIPGDGKWDIVSKAIDCPTVPGKNGNIMFRFTGSDKYWIKLQARNHKVPVAGIEVLKPDGKYSCLKRTSDNYFTGDKLGVVSFPMKVRVTAVTGEQREAVLPSLQNDNNILSDVQFSGFESGPGPAGIKCAGQGNKPPYPPGGMAPGGGVGPSTPVQPPSPPTEPTTGGGEGGGGGGGGGGEGEGISAPGTASGGGGGGSDFCKGKHGGTYPDPDDCAGFIICNIGKAHRQKCAPPLLFSGDSMNCNFPDKVDCGSRPRKYGDSALRLDSDSALSSVYTEVQNTKGNFSSPAIQSSPTQPCHVNTQSGSFGPVVESKVPCHVYIKITASSPPWQINTQKTPFGSAVQSSPPNRTKIFVL